MKSQARLRLRQPEPVPTLNASTETRMVRINNQPFRCQCGCNIFRDGVFDGDPILACNACGDMYYAVK